MIHWLIIVVLNNEVFDDIISLLYIKMVEIRFIIILNTT